MGSATKSERDAAFTAFVHQASPSLLRTAWLLTGDHHTAHDLVQAALVRTYVAWPRVRADSALAAICGAPTVDRAMALTGELFQVNTDMEAKYGALSEAMGGDIQRAIQVREDKVRGDVSTFANADDLQVVLSLNFLSEQALAVGSSLPLKLLPERLRVFG